MGAQLDTSSLANGGRTNGANGIKMDRKMSSPMAPPFMVSAPGKVIVWGEHSVVHGKVGQLPKEGRRGRSDCAMRRRDNSEETRRGTRC